MKNDKISELLEDTHFMAKVLEAATEDEVKEIFAEKGVKLQEGDINLLAQEIGRNASKSGIIPDQELKNISGGVSTGGAIGIGVGGAAIGAAAMTPVCVWAFKKGTDYANSWWNYCIHGEKNSQPNYKINPSVNKR